MTARSERALLIAIAVWIGCGQDKKPRSDEEWENRLVTKDVRKLSSKTVAERAEGAVGVAIVCCDFHRDEWRPALARVRPRACRELAQMIATERHPRVLEDLLMMPTPMCYETIPAESLLRLCRAGCSSKIRSRLLPWLAEIDPSPEAVKEILAQAEILAVPSEERAKRLIPLDSFGEDDLGAVVEMLFHDDPTVRDAAVSVFSSALMRAPLDLPEALRGLERVSEESDGELAVFARVVADDYRSSARLAPDATVQRYLADGDVSYDEIRMLAVRRFSCDATTARPLLEKLASARDEPQTAIAARRALAIRAKRCGLR